MKRLSVATCLFSLMALTGGIVTQAQDMKPVNFKVRIENVSGSNTQIYSSVGIDGIPVGASARAAAKPGEAFEFVVKAKPGDHLSFASMYGQSNDTFVGTNEAGIALYDASGKAISGDVSDQVSLWDAGTEVNEPLGKGPNQGPRQASPDAGTVENGTVQPTAFGGEWPASVADLTKVTLTPQTGDQILVHFENLTAKAPVPSPFSPLVYVVHTADQTGVFFKTGEKDRGQGLEHIAEYGNPEDLAAAVAGSAVMNVGLSPGVFVIHSDKQAAPIFKSGEKDRGQGLEAQAEDGNPTTLGDSLSKLGFKQTGIFNMPVGADKAGPLKPGQAFEFSFTAAPGDYLSYAEMFGQTNDLFFGTDEHGIALFSAKGTPIAGTFTGAIQIWDAGTEVNQEPFVGADQAPRQAAPNTGAAENGVVQPIISVTDGFSYPSVESSLKFTISNDAGMMMNVMAPANAMSDMMMPEMTPEAGMMMEATADASMMEMTPEATDSMMMQPTADSMMAQPTATPAS